MRSVVGASQVKSTTWLTSIIKPITDNDYATLGTQVKPYNTDSTTLSQTHLGCRVLSLLAGYQ